MNLKWPSVSEKRDREMTDSGHEIRAGRFLEGMIRDVRHMGRGLRRAPGFTIAVVLTLALAIGANTAIFSVVDQVLLRPLPYPEGDNLVMVYEHSRYPLSPGGSPRGP